MFLVWGLGISGKAALKLLKSKGFKAVAGDDRENPHLWKEMLGEVDCVVLSPGVPPNHPLWKEAIRRDIEVIGETELAYRFFSGKLVAITGTDGKSTTTELTYRMLKASGLEVYKGGNIGPPFSSVVLESPNSTVVLEVSSFQGKTLKDFRPDVGVFLNFSRDHLDWHPSLEDYLESKYRIFSNQERGDSLILGRNQPELLATPSRAKRIFLWRETLPFDENKVKLPGRHNLENLAGAAHAAMSLGATREAVEEVAYTFGGLPYRLEFLGEFCGLKVYNDSKSTTVNALKAALESFGDGSVILIAGGKDKGDDFSLARELVKRKVVYAFLIGETAGKIAKSWEDATECELCKDLKEAVGKAFERAKEAKVLLFSPACSSFDMFESYADRGRSFNELVQQSAGKSACG